MNGCCACIPTTRRRPIGADGAPRAAPTGTSRASIASAIATTPIAGCAAAAPRCEPRPAWRRRLAGSLTDITDAKLADALTGLPNRLLFLDLVERAIKRAERRADYALRDPRARRSIASAIVHDSLGPVAADRLLVGGGAAACRPACAPPTSSPATSPAFTLARLGGDEFNVLIDDIADASDAVLVADRLRRALEAPFEIDGHQVFASARIGIAASSTGYTRADDILRDAAIALNRADGVGTRACEIFDPGDARSAP